MVALTELDASEDGNSDREVTNRKRITIMKAAQNRRIWDPIEVR